MSWSVGYKGTQEEVADNIKQQFENSPANPEPEQAIKQEVAKLLLSAIQSEPKDCRLDVSAWGSQSTVIDEKKYNSLGVKIDVSW